jgi:Flp pilus assembly protein TadG
MGLIQKIRKQVFLRKLAKDERGVYSIEFALIIIPLFAMVFAIIELGIIFLTNNMLDVGASKAARLVRTGNAPTSTVFMKAITDNSAGLIKASKLTAEVINFKDLNDFDSKYKKSPALNPDGSTPSSFNAGGSEEIMLVRVYYSYEPFITGIIPSSTSANGSRILMTSFVFRNEPY